VLLYMLERGVEVWNQPVKPVEAAAFFYQYYMEKEFRKRIDFSDQETQRLWVYDEAKVAALIARMPMSKWSGSSKGLVAFEDGEFALKFDVLPEDMELLHGWTREICEYRLHVHFEQREVNNKVN
jgi:hypothetical protein